MGPTTTQPTVQKSPAWHYVLFSLIFVAVIAVIMVSYFRTEHALKHRIFDELSAIADLKLQQIVERRADWLAFAERTRQDPFFRDAVARWIESGNTDLRPKLLAWMATARKRHQFANVSLFDVSHRPLLAVDPSYPNGDTVLNAIMARSITTNTPQLSDLHANPRGHAHIGMTVPVLHPSDSARAVAVLLFEIDPNDFLFPLIQSWPMPSASGETLLIRPLGDSVEYLNTLRHRKVSPLSLRIPLNTPGYLGTEAIERGNGVYDRFDYRNEPVLGAVRKVPGTSWYLVAKVDKKEIMYPIRRLAAFFAALLFFLLLLAAALFLLLFRHARARHYRDLYYAEKEKRLSEARFRALFESMTEGVVQHEIVYDDRGKPINYRIIDVNPAFTRHTGIAADSARGKLATELYQAPTPPYFEEYLNVTRTGKPYFFETFFPPMGKHFAISVFSPGIDLFATVFEDITKQKNTEKERILTIEIFKVLNAANSMHDLMKNVLSVLRSWSGCEAAGIRIQDGEDFPYFEVQGFPETFVKKETYLCARDLEGQIVRDDIGNPVLECMCGNIIRGRFDPTKPFFTQNGSFWTNSTTDLLASTTEADRQSRTRNRCNGEGYESVALIPLRASGVTYGLIQLNDRRKNRFSPDTIALYERLAGSIAIALSHRRATEALAQSQKHLAAEKERLLVTLRSIGDGVITTDVHGNVTLMNKVAERLTGWEQADAVGRPLADVFHIINEQTRRRCENPVEKVLATGGVVGLANHTALIAKDGTERIIADSGAPIRDAQSNMIGVVLVFRDITIQQKTEEALRNADRLNAIGVLAGGIAHDFNNLLGGIFGYLSLAIDENKDKKTGQYLAKIMDTMDRARALTRQLLTFSKGGAPVRTRGTLFPLVQETAQFALSGANVSCFFDLAPDLWPCEFDKNQISQVIDNIVINAQQAMPHGGSITITARNEHLDEQQVATLKKGPYVHLSIRDSGIGIPPEILPRIFDPFFTTKQKGSGLGLATAFSIMNRHDGHIGVESIPGKGTTFHLYLPACTDDRQVTDTQPSFSGHSGKGTVIIMDDEEVMRDTIGAMLKGFGYTVIALCDGAELEGAYLAVVDKGVKPVAVILDLTVPGGMGGKEAGSKLRQKDPAVPIFISSGYAEDPILANPAAYGFTAGITKPFIKAELAALLEKYLGPKPR